MKAYNSMELMISIASRYIENGSSIVVGTGAPCAAGMLAQKLHAPDLLIMFEAGGVGAQLPTMPISVGDSRTFYRGLVASSMAEIMDYCQRGMIDYAFVGGAQIDCYGNINSTVIGEHSRPKVRFPGSGGANDLASLCWKTIIMTNHNKSRFVEKVDFVTTPGYLDGPGARERAGLPAGTGPYKVITDLCVMCFDEQSKRMKVESLHPGIERKQVEENTGFELIWDGSVKVSEPPSEDELRVLREEVDPLKIIIGRNGN
ncbi:MAG: glutaconate CoA-transferase [Peptococcaceae bacterium]|nr:glutaconate CoA-transferase [Peptococcaceae bacterium]